MVTLQRKLPTIKSHQNITPAHRHEMTTSNKYQRLAAVIPKILGAPSQLALWQLMHEAAAEILQASHTAVFLVNPDQQKVVRAAAGGFSDRFLAQIPPDLFSQPALLAVTMQQPLLIPDLSQTPHTLTVHKRLLADDIHALAVYPLTINQETRGAFALYSRHAGTFTAIDAQIGQTLAEISAGALKNLDLLADATRALRRERYRNEMTHTLSNTFELPAILLSVVRMATELVEADSGLLGLVIDDQMMTFYPHNLPPAMSLRPAARGRGVAWRIVETGETVLLHDYMQDPDAQPKWQEAGIHAFLGVPLSSGDERLGALTLFNTRPHRRFSERDRELAVSIGQQAAVAIQHARMFAEAQQRATALATALSRQEELDRLKTQFIHSVSHELRTPLGIIYGHAELLESGDLGPLEGMQKESLQIIVRRTRMLTDLVDDLTAMLAAETQELRRELINPAKLIASVIAEYQMQADGHNLTLTSNVEQSLPWIHGDLTHLRRVFDNLLSNAFKFTPAGGTVTLHAAANSNNVTIEVIDTGEGIDPQQLPHIFERFYQVKDASQIPRRKGTGLGLTLVKEIIEAHRGEVSVDSTPGQGTTFRIVLPGYPAPG